MSSIAAAWYPWATKTSWAAPSRWRRRAARGSRGPADRVCRVALTSVSEVLSASWDSPAGIPVSSYDRAAQLTADAAAAAAAPLPQSGLIEHSADPRKRTTLQVSGPAVAG